MYILHCTSIQNQNYGKRNKNTSNNFLNKNDSPVKILGNRFDCEGEENLLDDY